VQSQLPIQNNLPKLDHRHRLSGPPSQKLHYLRKS